ncbi:DUF423 domain-containing protein [Ruficoccus sp. ZRK36]|uniref:DUF423 domain-containing protein n=1 Tax=Ruficoccus sp. ZRK36 TaxID=2866311 RepID=UPI0031F324AD
MLLKMLFWAAFLGFTGVALGAFGAHALKDLLAERGMTANWHTAVKYQLVHAVSLLALASWLRAGRSCCGAARWTARLWVTGVLLFSGSLYLLTTVGWKWLGPVTPLGGLCLLGGWIALGASAFIDLKKPANTK